MKVFFDSSVIVAALFSETGASAVLFSLTETGIIDGYISQGVIEEVEEVLRRKLPESLAIFRSLVKTARLKVTRFITKAQIQKAKSWIRDPKDAKILAAAKKEKVDYLLTLDIKHFIHDPDVTKKSKLQILTPGDFLTTIIRG